MLHGWYAQQEFVTSAATNLLFHLVGVHYVVRAQQKTIHLTLWTQP